MGTISEQLKLINTQLGYAKDSINNKYSIMDMPSIPDLKVKEISTRIDDIPVLNTKDATALEPDIIENKIAYNNAKQVIGKMKNLDNTDINLNMYNASGLLFKAGDINGYIGPNTKFKVNKKSLADELNIIPSIIKKGETILDINGEYSGLEVTGDATATNRDIVEPKTAYVNNKKITGTLKDFRDESLNPLFSVHLDGDEIRINVEEGAYNPHSKIRIGLKQIANLIKLTPDKIKDGEEVLGIIGNYTKPNKPEEVEPDITGNYVEYQTRENFLHFDFKWGYWELTQLPASENQFNKVQLYDRIYNAYYYNGECDGYYLNNDKSTIYASTYNHNIAGNSLSCYVYDLNLKANDCYYIWGKVFYDCPELLMKFAPHYYTSDSNGIIKYLFFETFDKQTMKEYKNTCLNTFKEICSIIKNTYGINYKADLSSWNSYVETYDYSSNEKFKIAKVIHDYLVLNNVYGYTEIKHLDQVMYPALSKGKYTPVCASYSKAFMWCCQKFGIYALPVVGYAGERHMWNMVCYEKGYNNSLVNAHGNSSVWNEVDVTWDDPSTTTKCNWTYFNVTTNFLKGSAGGNRVRGKIGVTDFGNEYYNDYISECSCTSYKYNGNTHYGGL